MGKIKSTDELNIIIQGGKKLSYIRNRLLKKVKPGVTPKDIEALANDLIHKSGGKASFKQVPGYNWATCINVNDVVVHGIPTNKPFVSGDIVGIDIGLLFHGYNTDTADTILVEDTVGPKISKEKHKEKERFLETGRKTLKYAIKQAIPGNHIGHISKAIQDTIENAGYSIVRSLVGHGVGKRLHEWPEVPGFLIGKYTDTPQLHKDMVLAIEIIYAQGLPDITINNDGWTIVTKDHSLSGLFEHTIIVTNKPKILTL